MESTLKIHKFGSNTGWDSATDKTVLKFQGHGQFWIGAGNGTWYTGAANTISSETGLLSGNSSHDLLITTMSSSPSRHRGIVFGAASDEGLLTGHRLGKWHSGSSASNSLFVVDGQIYAKGGHADSLDFYANQSSYFDSGSAAWVGEADWSKPSIVASMALMIQSGSSTIGSAKPTLQFHQFGYGGPEIHFDGPNKILFLGQPGSADRLRYVRIKTNHGRTDIGAMNANYSHFQTDRPAFYFEKRLIVDEGIVQSYSQDLNLNRAGSTTARLRITSGKTYSDQPIELNPISFSSVESISNAPITISTINVGSNSAFLPFMVQRAPYAAGYVTHASIGLYKGINGWGEGNTGLYFALGKNDSNPTEFFKMTTGGGIIHSYGHKFWSSSNDGAGSGLDADLWDGQQFSSYLNQGVRTSDSPRFSDMTLDGNLTVGSINKSSNSVIKVNSSNSFMAGFEAHGGDQGTGYLYVGQETSHGGGVSYNGDGTPAFIGGERGDEVLFYRRTAGVNHAVFGYIHNSNDVLFRGNLTAPSFIGSLNGNAATATKLNSNWTSYKGVTDNVVAGQLMWKNYGNSHVIYDASNATTPSGSAKSNVNPENAWVSGYPTLMGFNGTNTYGVRVDTSRYSEQLKTARTITLTGEVTGSVSFNGTANVSISASIDAESVLSKMKDNNDSGLVPAGAVMPFAMITPPAGWLVADGSAVSRSTYPALYAAIGDSFGAGNGTSTFNLPDLRGEFVRGYDAGRGADVDRVFGSAQGDAMRNITGRAGSFRTPGNASADADQSLYVSNAANDNAGDGDDGNCYNVHLDASRQVPTADENRPRNIALSYCIKF